MIKKITKQRIEKEDSLAIYYKKIQGESFNNFLHVIYKPQDERFLYNKEFYRILKQTEISQLYKVTNGFSLYSGSFVIGGFIDSDILYRMNTTDIIGLTKMNHDQRNHPKEWITFGTLSVDDDYGFLVYDIKNRKYILTNNFQKVKILKEWTTLDELIDELVSFYENKYNENGVSKTYNNIEDPMIANLVNYKYSEERRE
jgi:hypothetical protein